MKIKYLSGGLFALFLVAPAVMAARSHTLRDNVPAVVKQLKPQGQLASTNRLNLAISLPLRNTSELATLLQDIYDPTSPNYHHYLTPEAFTERFGPTKAQYNALVSFAKANGLKVTAMHPNRMLLDVSGTTASVEKAMHVKLNLYRHPTENRMFYAPDMEPTMDISVAVLQVSGLDDFSLPRPRYVDQGMGYRPDLAFNSGSGPSGTYMGYDFRAAYVPDTTLTGAGQSVGLLQFDGYTASDITYYENLAGLPNVPLQKVLIDGATGLPSGTGGEIEVSLDIDMAVSMAPSLSNIVLYIAPNPSPFVDILNRMATDNSCRQLSCSWYQPNGTAQPTADQIFQQMAAQGQSFFNASGDNDAYTGLISFPGDTPYITQVGGTTLTMNGAGSSYNSETVWNWGITLNQDGVGSGGGISTQYAIPAYQTNINMTASKGSRTMRNTPDVALTADNVYVRADGANYRLGGTSCAAPLWAGFAALANQQASASSRSPIGFINQTVDTICSGSSYANCFHDIITGNNTWSQSPTNFYAVTGYDLCTGWGTPRGQKLIDSLVTPEALVINPASGFTSAGGAGGPFTITSQILTLTNIGTNSITWTLSNTAAWLTASPVGGPLGAAHGTNVTVSLNTAASNLTVGVYSATIYFTNVNDGVVQGRQFTLNVIAPPAIVIQPTNLTLVEGVTASFTASATGGLPLYFQWQLNGVNLTNGGKVSGATTTNLIITGVISNDAGAYSVVVTNAAGMAVSSNALLTLIPSAPIITAQPASQKAIVGQNITFTVGAVGTSPLSYQWRFNGTNIQNETSASLTLNNVQLSQSGTYSVTITNIYSGTNSAGANLLVTTCDPLPADAVSWWQAEGSAVDLIGTNNGTAVGNVAYTAGEVGEAFSFDGVSSYVSVPASQSLDVGANGTGFTIEGWIQPSSGANGAIIEWDTTNNAGVQLWCQSGLQLFANIPDTNGVGHTIGTSSGALDSSYLQHVALTYDKASGVATLYINGNPAATSDLGSFTPETSPADGYHLNIGGRVAGILGTYLYAGTIDELTIYQRALTADEILYIFAAGAVGKCQPANPPVVVTEPSDTSAYVGKSAQFSVAASGTTPLSYQWYFNGTNKLSGATGSTLTLSSVQLTNAGLYSVTITNLYGAATSSNAVLTVNLPPPCAPVLTNIVAWWPGEGNANDIVGTNNGTATGNLTYVPGEVGQAFMFDGSSSTAVTFPPSASLDIGATGTGITIEGWILPASDTANGAIAEWDAANDAGLHLWCESGLQLYANIEDTTGTGHVIYAPGVLNSTNFQHVAVTYDKGSGAVYLYVNGGIVASNNFGTITPQTSPSAYHLNIGQRNAGYIGIYTFTGAIDELSLFDRALGQSEIQTIYLAGQGGKCVPQAPIIVSQPSDAGVLAGQTAQFVVRAMGATPLHYQWYFNGTNLLAGATGSVLALSNVQATNTGGYFVIVTNNYGSVTSRIATLTVLQPPVILIQPQSRTNAAGTTATFTVTASGTMPLIYQWRKNGTTLVDGGNIYGALTSTLTISNVAYADGANYTVVITNVAGSVTSAVATLTVLASPIILVQPQSCTNFVTTTATFTVTAVGTPQLYYQWRKGGIALTDTNNISGSTTTTLTLTNVSSNDAGNYAVVITNSYGSITSVTATLTINPLPPCTPVSTNIVAWWPADGNANDIVGTNNATPSGGVVYTNSEVGQAFLLNGSTSYLSLAPSSSLDIGASGAGFTIECWIKPASNVNAPILEWESSNSQGVQMWCQSGLQLFANISDTSGTGHVLYTSTGALAATNYQHVALTYDKGSGAALLYINGSIAVTNNFGTITPQTSASAYHLLIGRRANSGTYTYSGTIDELSLYNRALSLIEIQNIFNAGQGGKCVSSLAPSIITQPTNQSVAIGGVARFNVTATGMPVLGYQWYFNGTNKLLGATSTQLTVNNAQLTNGGSYSVVVTNAYGLAISSNAVLTVQAPPAIVVQPTNQNVGAGRNVTFSVTATGTPSLSYQWNSNAIPVLNATNSTYVLSNAQAVYDAFYSVAITNLYGSVLSSNALLIVTPDHFAWKQVPSPRFVSTPFTVTVYAQDAINGIFTNFNGAVFLTTTNGVSLNPSVSGNFIQGAWTGLVTIAQAGTNFVPRVADSFGDFGLGNAINVVNLPGLTVTPSGNTLYIFWPASPSGFVLEMSADLASGAWIPVTAPPIQIGDQFLEPVTISGTNAFYRLRFTGQ